MSLLNGPTVLPPPEMKVAPVQNVTGGILNNAADVTISSRNHQIETAAKFGAGQKGAGRRKKKVRRGGAANLNVTASLLPSAGSIPGVDPTNSHIKGIDNLNAIRAAATYDKASSLPAYDPTPTSGGKRTKRKSKHGRRHNRTHRRGHNKSTRTRHRSRRHV